MGNKIILFFLSILMFSKLSHFILRMMGWSFKGSWPEGYKKLMVIVVPHTSNWDFPLGVLYRSYLNREVKFVGKASLFRFPVKGLLKAMGGIPVNRSKSSNFVDNVIKLYNDRETLFIQLAPEGTRKKVKKLKSGFYYIAQGANIPILMIKFNYKDKEFEIGEPLMPSDFEKDMKQIDDFYRNTIGYNKEYSYLCD